MDFWKISALLGAVNQKFNLFNIKEAVHIDDKNHIELSVLFLKRQYKIYESIRTD